MRKFLIIPILCLVTGYNVEEVMSNVPCQSSVAPWQCYIAVEEQYYYRWGEYEFENLRWPEPLGLDWAITHAKHLTYMAMKKCDLDGNFTLAQGYNVSPLSIIHESLKRQSWLRTCDRYNIAQPVYHFLDLWGAQLFDDRWLPINYAIGAESVACNLTYYDEIQQMANTTFPQRVAVTDETWYTLSSNGQYSDFFSNKFNIQNKGIWKNVLKIDRNMFYGDDPFPDGWYEPDPNQWLFDAVVNFIGVRQHDITNELHLLANVVEAKQRHNKYVWVNATSVLYHAQMRQIKTFDFSNLCPKNK